MNWLITLSRMGGDDMFQTLQAGDDEEARRLAESLAEMINENLLLGGPYQFEVKYVEQIKESV